MNITAQYDVHLPAYLMVCIDEGQSTEYAISFSIDDFRIEITLIPDKSVSQRTRKDTNSPWGKPTYGVNYLRVRVSREENGELNSITSRTIEIHRQYENIAETAINRLIRFFQYKLNTPLIREVNAHDDPWSNNPKWYDNEGHEIDMCMSTSDGSRHLAYGYFPRFGMKALVDVNDSELKEALERPFQEELYEEFICNARTEIIEQNYKRAVIEMAIACEVLVKTIFFSANPISGAVFDYLASQRKIEVSVPELIDKPAKEVFGESFKDKYKNDFINIGYLFRARNRVVHSGHCNFKDNKGVKNEVDEFVLEDWWQSITTLTDWFKGMDVK